MKKQICVLWALGVLAGSAALAAPAKTITLPATQGKTAGGVTLATAIPGYAAGGYATGFTQPNSQLTWSFPSPTGGLYRVYVRYSSPDGPKGYTLVVDGSASDGSFLKTGNGFAVNDGGLVLLHKGINTLSVQRGWGYFDINFIRLISAASLPLPQKPPVTLADPDATPKTRALMRYLVSLYGHRTLSGGYKQSDANYVKQITGKSPAIIGGDFIDYSPTRLAYGANPNHESSKMIQRAKNGHIITMSWHWNAPADLLNTKAQPWWKGFYTTGSTFNLQDALSHPNSKNYHLLLSNMDAIAAQLQKFNKAGVPVLWRPLHEAEGGWFWWGADGPQAFKQLWRLMFNRFTYHDHLHNLIWVDCSGLNTAWYPGNKYVDIIGIDEYPSDVQDPLSTEWETLQKEYNGKKLVALSEFGGVPDVAKMAQYGVHFSYFVSWSGNVGPRKMAPAALKQIYDSPLVVNKGNLNPSLFK